VEPELSTAFESWSLVQLASARASHGSDDQTSHTRFEKGSRILISSNLTLAAAQV
jgi:hypothetical protein